MIGVDYELFWTLNPKSLSPFVKAFSLKLKFEDRSAWQIGMYVKIAIASSFDKQSKYPTSPLMADKGEDDPIARQQNIKDKMLQQMAFHNARFEKKG